MKDSSSQKGAGALSSVVQHAGQKNCARMSAAAVSIEVVKLVSNTTGWCPAVTSCTVDITCQLHKSKWKDFPTAVTWYTCLVGWSGVSRLVMQQSPGTTTPPASLLQFMDMVLTLSAGRAGG